MKLNKKGQSVMDNFGSLAIGVAGLCITLVVAFLIMTQAKTNMQTDASACPSGFTYTNATSGCCNLSTARCGTIGDDKNTTGYSTAYNSTATLQNATAGIPGWVSIIIITAIGAALIGMVAMFKR